MVLFCRTFSQFVGNVPFRGERNEPLMVNQAKFFQGNYTNRVVHLFTAFLPLASIVNMC